MTVSRACRRIVVLAMVLTLAGCAALRRSAARHKGGLLVAAGFHVQRADEAVGAPDLYASPPLKIVSQATDGQLEYRLADPYECRCVYVGDPTNYAAYQRLVAGDYFESLMSVAPVP